MLDREPSASARRAREAVPDGGVVLDVGVGAGAGSLPLSNHASRIVGVDASEDMLGHFLAIAGNAGIAVEGIVGRWPEVAGRVGPADVVLCTHVLYNVPDIAPFVEALWAHARRRVVIEIPDRYPWAWTADLWLRFHGVEMPSGPTADDAEGAIEELDLRVMREEEVRAPEGGFRHRGDAVAMVRRRLCLTADRDPEIAEALGSRLGRTDGLWWVGTPTRTAVTLWSDT
ncbi:MAG: class I SAM-dependent methyltransferase [Acidimicrobiales bacterium]